MTEPNAPQEPNQADEPLSERERGLGNIVLLAFFVILIAAGIWLVNAMVEQRAMDVVIKTSADPWTILPAVRKEIAALDPDQPLGPVHTFEEMLNGSMAPRSQLSASMTT